MSDTQARLPNEVMSGRFNQNASAYIRQVIETGEPITIKTQGTNKEVMVVVKPEHPVEAAIRSGDARPPLKDPRDIRGLPKAHLPPGRLQELLDQMDGDH